MGKKNNISKMKKDDKYTSIMTTRKRFKIVKKRKASKIKNLNELENSNINTLSNELKINLYAGKKT